MDNDSNHHNDILGSIDFLDSRNDGLRQQRNENVDDDPTIHDDSRAATVYDENSSGNYEMPLLGSSSGCNLNLNIPVNDESSNESMDIESDNERVVDLGDINIEAKRATHKELVKDQSTSNECLSTFFSVSESFESFQKIDNKSGADAVGKGDCLNFDNVSKSNSIENMENKLKFCSKCMTKLPNDESNEQCIKCNIIYCDSDCISASNNSSHTSKHSDDDICQNNSYSKDKLETSHMYNENCDTNLNTTPTEQVSNEKNSISDSNNKIKLTDDVFNTSAASVAPLKECECDSAANALDHVNGHSSKTYLISKMPCKKCSTAPSLPIVPPNETSQNTESKAVNEEDKHLPDKNIADAPNVGRENVRPRDICNADNIRPIKKMKLNNGNIANRIKTPRTIFHKALDAVSMTWENQHLKQILASNTYSLKQYNSIPSTTKVTTSKTLFNCVGQPLWHEPLAMCAARVDSLRSHGHTDAALRLSISVVRTMKQVQNDAQGLWHRYQKFMRSQMPHLEEDIQNHHNGCECRKTKLFHVNNATSADLSPNKNENCRIYRYDNNHGVYNSARSNCRRCMENKDRYHSNYVNNFGANRYNVQQHAGSSSSTINNYRRFHLPSFFHNNIGPMRNGFSGHRYGASSNRFAYPYHNNYSSNMHGTCHRDMGGNFIRPRICPGNGAGNESYFFGAPRQHFHKEMDKNVPENYDYDGPPLPPGRTNHLSKISTDADRKDIGISSNCSCKHGKSNHVEGHKHMSNGNQLNNAAESNDVNQFRTSDNNVLNTINVNACPEQSKSHCSTTRFYCNCFEKIKCCSGPIQTPNCNCISVHKCTYCGHNKSNIPAHKSCNQTDAIACSSVNHSQNTSTKATNSNSIYNIVNYGASTSKASVESTTTTSSINTASNTDFSRNKKSECVSNCLDCSVGCEIEFPLEAVACIFDCLTEACIIPDTINGPNMGRLSFDSISGATEDGNVIQPKYQHVPVPFSSEPNETYLTLAFEAAILALGKQRVMPQGLYSQHVICKQQDQLIGRLRHVDLDRLLIDVLKQLSDQMLDGGPSSGLGLSIHPESVPMHTLARFLFASLLNQYPDLAYKVGLRAMRLPVLDENAEQTDNIENNFNPHQNDGFVLSRYPRWWTLGHLETQQCSLSSAMLSAAKGDPARLSSVLESARRNIHSASHIFKLAQDAFRFATPESDHRNRTLLGVAFELGLQVMRMTLTCLNWRRKEMVRWLVTCSTQLGLDALISIMQNWYHLFTPTEATGPVATIIMSHSARLNLNILQQDELAACARNLALQCATKDPPNCALNALTLCENDPNAFETAYQIVIDASMHIMTSSQLFTIARYMEHRGYPMRAYKLAMLAMKNVHLAYNQDTHPAINDIHWACALSHSLGKAELANIIPLVIKNVQCATVLSDILRRCSVPSPAISHFNVLQRGNNMRPCHKLNYDRAPLRQLLEAAVAAYVKTTHSRLAHISPRHYGDFIDFLGKARDTFVLARDGPAHFSRLIENITVAYKGKKKLVRQVRQRFQFI